MDAHSCFTNETAHPEPGDVSVCMNCGREYIRHGDRWQPITAAERAALPPETLLDLEQLEWTRQLVIREDLAKRGGRA